MTDTVDTEPEDTEFDVVDDEAETEGDEEPFDLIGTIDEYTAADRAQRAVIWAELSDEERTAMALGGITGPRQAPADEEAFDLVGPDDPAYASTMQLAKATVKMGVSYIRSGDLDVSEELAERIVELAEIAEMLPDGDLTRTEALQTAAAMVDNAIAEAKAPSPSPRAWSASGWSPPTPRATSSSRRPTTGASGAPASSGPPTSPTPSGRPPPSATRGCPSPRR